MATNRKGGLVATGTVEGTAAQIDVNCGFDVGYVDVYNYDDAGGLSPRIEWYYGMTNYHGIKTVEDSSISMTLSETWHCPIPLSAFREVTSNDIPAISVLSEAAPNTVDFADGGLLCKDSTPIFEFVNGDTDSQMRINWAASNSDAIAVDIALPADLNTAQDLTLKLLLETGSTDTTGWTVESFFQAITAAGITYSADTKVADTSGALIASKAAIVSTTIAAADIPSAVTNLALELTPAAHTTDAQYLYGAWIEGTRSKAVTSTLADQMSLVSKITSGGLAAYSGTATQKGFSIGTDSDLNVSGETLFYRAFERWS